MTAGLGRPEGLNRGYYIRPTIFGNVTNDMTIAREEIFGPVLSILPYKDEAEAIRVANDTVYGLAAYVQSADIDHARAVAAEMRRRLGLSQLSGLGHIRTLRRLQSSPATVANMPIGASTISSRSRASSAGANDAAARRSATTKGRRGTRRPF